MSGKPITVLKKISCQLDDFLQADELNLEAVVSISPEDVLSKYSHLKIDESTNIPPPVPILKIGGEIISTEGNITALAGPPKGGKSAFCYVIIAGAIATGEYDGMGEVEVAVNTQGRAVLHFDTEQSRYKHQFNVKTILKRCHLKNSPPYFLSYNIRALRIDEYRKITIEIIDAAYKLFNGIHLIVIDGIADYIADVNDTQTSNDIVKFFEEISVNYSVPIITVIHLNPNSEKERGNLGSQIQRKAESLLHVKSIDDISTVEPKFLRMAGKGNIPLIQFSYDKTKGYHSYCGVKEKEDLSIKDVKRLEAVEKLSTEVFGPGISYTYQEAVNAIMKVSKKKIVTAKGFFTEMNAHKMITQGSDKLWRTVSQKLDDETV